jgi:2-oxo-3-hexenedioate decarboxylase/2-keto-4-pentenoate hydratase
MADATEHLLDQAVHRLVAARLGGTARDALPPDERPADEAAAYRLQDRMHARLAAALGPCAGHKIGCTTEVMQRYLRIANPCAGWLLARTVHRHHADLRYSDFVRVGVECELAVLLGAEVDPAASESELRDGVAAVMAAIEIVDDRWLDYSSVGTPSLIADDFFGAGCVLATPREQWRQLDLARLGGVMRINGREVGRGLGADILGDPFAALAWLARNLASRGQALRANDIVLLGSLVKTQWLAPGDRVEVDVEELGSASAHFD